MTFLGAGIGYRRAMHDELVSVRGGGPAVLEVMPDVFFDHPARLESLAERYPIVFHDVGLSIATVGDASIAKARLQRIAALIAIGKPILFGEHLALTRSPSGIELGHLAPVWLVRELLDLVTDRVRALQDVLGIPIVLETSAAPFSIPDGDFTEGEFFSELVERTQCGLLLDLTNVMYNARNANADPIALLRSYPLTAVRQIHLAGGIRDSRGKWVDSHSEPVEHDAYELLRHVRDARDSLLTIIVERDSHLGPMSELVGEADRADGVWRGMR